MNITLKDIDDLKEHVAKAVVEQVKNQIAPVVAKVEEIEVIKRDVAQLKQNQAKALIGYSVLVAGVTLFFDHVKAWLSAKFS